VQTMLYVDTIAYYLRIPLMGQVLVGSEFPGLAADFYGLNH